MKEEENEGLKIIGKPGWNKNYLKKLKFENWSFENWNFENHLRIEVLKTAVLEIIWRLEFWKLFKS